MTSNDVFLRNLSKLNVDSIVIGYVTPTFISVFETVCIVELTSIFHNVRYLNGQLCKVRPKYGHIRHQHFQINIKQRFVFQFSHILVLTGFPVFSAAILDRRYEPKTLVCNPIQSNELKNPMYQFEESCKKNEDMRVPH